MYDGQTTTSIVFNEADESRKFYNLEERLNNMAYFYKNVYIYAIFDCCREKILRTRNS
jgi:hypothetical protein